MSRKLAAFAGFCTLGYFYLYLIGIDKVFSCDAKTSAGYLFYCTSYASLRFRGE